MVATSLRVESAEGSKSLWLAPYRGILSIASPDPPSTPPRGVKRLLWDNSSIPPAHKSFLMSHFICPPQWVGMAEAPTPGPRMSQLSSEDFQKPSQRLRLRGEEWVRLLAEDYSHLPPALPPQTPGRLSTAPPILLPCSISTCCPYRSFSDSARPGCTSYFPPQPPRSRLRSSSKE